MPFIIEGVFPLYILCVNMYHGLQICILHIVFTPWNSSLKPCFLFLSLSHLVELLMAIQCFIACVTMCSHGNMVPNAIAPPYLQKVHMCHICSKIIHIPYNSSFISKAKVKKHSLIMPWGSSIRCCIAGLMLFIGTIGIFFSIYICWSTHIFHTC